MLKELQKIYASKTKRLNEFGSQWLDESTPEYEQRAIAIKEKREAFDNIVALWSTGRTKCKIELRIALAIMKSYDLHENSWNTQEYACGGNGYAMSSDSCIQDACKCFNVPFELWRILDLATDPSIGWSNDAQDWADSVIGNTFSEDYEESLTTSPHDKSVGQFNPRPV